MQAVLIGVGSAFFSKLGARLNPGPCRHTVSAPLDAG